MSSDKKLTNFIQGSAILIAANLAIKGINFFLLPLYTAYLPPDSLGISDSISTITAFLFPILVMGMDSAFSAFFYDKKTKDYEESVFSTSSVFLFLAGLVPIGTALFGGHVSQALFDSPSYASIVSVALVGVSFNMWYLPLSLLVRMENRMLLFAGINLCASVLTIGCNVFFLTVLHLETASLIFSTALVQGIILVLYLWLGKRRVRLSSFDGRLLKEMLRYALPFIPTAAAIWILGLSDRYMLLAFDSPSEAGIYGIAARVATMLASISSSVFTAYTSYAFNKKDEEDAKGQFKTILSSYYMIFSAFCLVLAFLGFEIVTLMTKPGYLRAYQMIPGLIFGQVLYGVNTVVGYGNAFYKKSRNIFFATLAGAALNLGLNVLLIPYFGGVAAAYTTYAGFFVMMLVSYKTAQRYYPCDYGIIKIIGSSLLYTGIAFVTNQFLNDFWIRMMLLVVLLALNYGLYAREFNSIIKWGVSVIRRRKGNG